ncbi:MAG TPA: hypothetical protein VLT88_14245, partial [Desulfosarcina sp.]|nr:hypothetical protein [Desulfosarcina sp.]
MMFAAHDCRWWVCIWGAALLSAACAGVDPRRDRMRDGLGETAETVIQMQTVTPARGEAIRTPPPGPLSVTVAEAILMCLENNRSLVVQRLTPAIRQTVEDQEAAQFDPLLNTEIFAGRIQGERLARSGSETESFTTDTADGVISLAQYFPTGTSVALEAGAAYTDSSLYDDRFYEARLGMTVNQALLRGLGT